MILGDANIHFRSLAQHATCCECVHCKPSRTDSTITRMLEEAGFIYANTPGCPTHVSGSTPDLLLMDVPALLPPLTTLPPGQVGDSDHSLIYASWPLCLPVSYRTGFGRVWWASTQEWDTALGAIDEALKALSKLVDLVVSDPELLSLSAQRKQILRRRAILDACVWLRDAWYTVAGHLAGAI